MSTCTNTELHFLAKVQASLPGKEGDAYRASFIKGIHYLLAAQYPNGGFPQVYPLEGGYHDAITFNDNAVSESAETLTDVAEAKPGYDFVAADLRKQAASRSYRRQGDEVHSGIADRDWREEDDPEGRSRRTR